MYNRCHHPNVVLFWNKLDHHIYIHSDTWDILYYIQVSIQGVSHTKCNAINYINKSSSMQKEQ